MCMIIHSGILNEGEGLSVIYKGFNVIINFFSPAETMSDTHWRIMIYSLIHVWNFEAVISVHTFEFM